MMRFGKLWLQSISLVMAASALAWQVSAAEPARARHAIVHSGESSPIWGFDFLDSEHVVFSVRDGALKILNLKTKEVKVVSGVPAVYAKGQGGLLDVRVGSNKELYFSLAEPVGGGATTSFYKAEISDGKLKNLKKLLQAKAVSSSGVHFGGRIEFAEDGNLFFSVGDRNEREKAQELGFHNGKILRVDKNGKAPTDNPFVKTKGALAEIWSYGHRNPQGLVRSSTGELWSAEFGPRGGDEINLIKRGSNYGWPVVTYGREYSGLKISSEVTKPGMEPPVAHYVPSISPSGITFYTGDLIKAWKGQMFLGCLGSTHLRRVRLERNSGTVGGYTATEQEELFQGEGMRIRAVRTGPDGALYFSTDEGTLARVSN